MFSGSWTAGCLMDSERREVSTRQVRIALVVIGALALSLAIVARRPAPGDADVPVSGQLNGVDQTDLVALPDPNAGFAEGLEDPEAEWRRVAERSGIAITDVEEALARADQALEEGILISPAEGNALDLYLAIREFDPQNEGAIEGVGLIRYSLIEQLRNALAERDMDTVEAVFPSLDRIGAEDHDVEILAGQVSRIKQADALIRQARSDREADKLVQPTGDNALARLLRARQLDPGHPEVKTLLIALERELVDRALGSARQLDFRAAENWVQWAQQVRDGSTAIDHARQSIAEYKAIQLEQLSSSARTAMRESRFELAVSNISRIQSLGSTAAVVESLEKELASIRVYGIYQPGQTFRDPLAKSVGVGPEMVVIPNGAFIMGSTPGEPGHSSHDEPRHPVTFSHGFALSRKEVSVAEFRLFVEQTGYQTDAEREGHTSVYKDAYGRNTRSSKANWQTAFNGHRGVPDEPVVHVSWNDATAYVKWLAEYTGKPYRLPTEAEFEYAMRAGSSSTYWWGSGSPTELVENTTGDGDRSRRRRTWDLAFSKYSDGYWGPAPVGSFQANGFKLFDMAGNVQEWVEDCWHDSYVRAPSDGRAWVNRGCRRRVVRGGFWGGEPSTARSAYRAHHSPNLRGSSIGFRVARGLISPPSRYVAKDG
jgi:formylglycine-generating enzyme required for sulfatase activity